MDWLPVETSPENEWVLGRREGFNSYTSRKMYRKGKIWWVEGTWIMANPTHWRPLPTMKPNKTSNQEEK